MHLPQEVGYSRVKKDVDLPKGVRRRGKTLQVVVLVNGKRRTGSARTIEQALEVRARLLGDCVTYRIVMPEQLRNVVVLDASFQIRKLVHYDKTIQNAETLPSCRQHGVKFEQIKRYDQAPLLRWTDQYGEGIQVGQRYRQGSGEGGADHEDAGVNIHATIPGTDRPRMVVQTWGNETSLNCYAYCRHVVLVGILHRDDTLGLPSTKPWSLSVERWKPGSSQRLCG